jgi:hypothetical protein
MLQVTMRGLVNSLLTLLPLVLLDLPYVTYPRLFLLFFDARTQWLTSAYHPAPVLPLHLSLSHFLRAPHLHHSPGVYSHLLVIPANIFFTAFSFITTITTNTVQILRCSPCLYLSLHTFALYLLFWLTHRLCHTALLSCSGPTLINWHILGAFPSKWMVLTEILLASYAVHWLLLFHCRPTSKQCTLRSGAKTRPVRSICRSTSQSSNNFVCQILLLEQNASFDCPSCPSHYLWGDTPFALIHTLSAHPFLHL